jgi:hypothetical protein
MRNEIGANFGDERLFVLLFYIGGIINLVPSI